MMTRKSTVVAVFTAALATLTVASQVRADLITPSTVSGSDVGYGSMYPTNLNDNSGLSGPPYTAASTHNTDINDMWLSGDLSSSQWVAFDLGANYDLTDTVIWNYNISTQDGRCLKDYNLYVSDSIAGGWTQLGGLRTMDTQPGATSETDPAVAASVRRVKIEAVSAYSSTDVGLSEVKFNGTLSASQDTRQIITPTGASASSFLSDAEPGNTINSSGFATYNTNTRDQTHGGTWTDMWRSNGEAVSDASITFDLGELQYIGGALIWNYNQLQTGAWQSGVKDFEVWISTDGPSGTFTYLDTLSLDAAPGGGAPAVAQYLEFAGTYASAIKFDIISNYGLGDVGLSEVRFVSGTVVIPEPASAVLLALAGLLMLRRRKVGQTRRG